MKRLWILLLIGALVGVPAAASWADEAPVKQEPAISAAGETTTEAIDTAARAGAPSYVPWVSGAVHLAIPDNNPSGVSHDILVLDPGVVFDLDVAVVITHTWVGDITATLTHLDTGTTAGLIVRPGNPTTTFGCSGDNIDATLDDEAALLIENQCAAAVPTISGSFIPNNPLSVFDGESLAGTWRLAVSDAAGGDTGFLESWTLRFGVQRCNGLIATIIGTPGNDILTGTGGPDVIVGLKGNDTIDGRGGNDTICGGPGNDTLVGGAGADWLNGGGGTDTADYASAGGPVLVDLQSKTASGGGGADTLLGIENVTGSPFGDKIIGSAGANRILGGHGADWLIGNGGPDRLFGEAGDDTLEGYGGNDILVGGPGIDTANGGAGTDTCTAEISMSCEL